MEIKEYSNGEVTILWEASKCIHSANCVNGLPEVFDINQKPWINPKGTDSAKIIETVSKCPSGALTMKEKQSEIIEDTTVEMHIRPNGSLSVVGKFKLIDADGNQIETKSKISLCRCGASENKPFCDGKHRNINFIG